MDKWGLGAGAFLDEILQSDTIIFRGPALAEATGLVFQSVFECHFAAFQDCLDRELINGL
jgi:hypothetical protein